MEFVDRSIVRNDACKELDAYLLAIIGYTTESYDFIFINRNICLFIGLPDHAS
jgi:hypothetical protein